jgi:hypothetical protein
VEDCDRALSLWREAAELGHPFGQYIWGAFEFGEGDRQRFMWWGRSAERGDPDAATGLIAAANKQLFEVEVRSPCIVFELGAAFRDTFGAAECLA